MPVNISNIKNVIKEIPPNQLRFQEKSFELPETPNIYIRKKIAFKVKKKKPICFYKRKKFSVQVNKTAVVILQINKACSCNTKLQFYILKYTFLSLMYGNVEFEYLIILFLQIKLAYKCLHSLLTFYIRYTYIAYI